MAQLTIRTSDELVARVRDAAGRPGRSMNEYVVAVLGAATDPDLAGDDVERSRERLARAGILAPAGVTRPRPDADAVQLAGALAARTALPECHSFAVFDRELGRAAAAEGFTLFRTDRVT